MNGYDLHQARPAYVAEEAQSSLLRSVFGWMAFGLAVTWLVSLYVLQNAAVASVLLRPGILFALLAGELGLVVWLRLRVMQMTGGAAASLFLCYSALNGVTLTPLAFVYTQQSIAAVFLTTAGAFAGTAFIGYVTKRDLAALGSFVIMGLWGIIVAAIVNLFLASDAVAFAISVAGVIVFTGLTAWDVQRIKRLAGSLDAGSESFRRQAIIGALALYLDFINLFISLLRLLGDRR